MAAQATYIQLVKVKGTLFKQRGGTAGRDAQFQQ